MRIVGLRAKWAARDTKTRPRTVAVVAVAAAALGASLGVVPSAHAAAGGSSLSAGQELQAGQDLVSAGGQYTLVMQTDGNLVTYGNGCVIWASNTAGTGSHDYLAMQGDGNLVIYTSAGKPVWASNTAGSGGQNSLDMQVDGNLVVYTSGGKPVWASGASQADQLCEPATMSAGKYLHSSSGQYTLDMQGDGNLVVYDNGGAIWASDTAGTGSANFVAMQGDGNLVVYTGAGKPVWASNTAGSGSKNSLVMQNDGNLVVYTSAGKPVWASNTANSGSGGSGGGSSIGSKIASIAKGQEGVEDKPADTYCNPYTAHWGDGTACSGGLRANEWCADFAAWAWQQAGVSFTYGFKSSDINADANSFYYWAAAHGTWHAAGSGYTPQPGDVAVYGSSPGGASHVGIVVSNGSSGPNVVNGDWEIDYPSTFPTAVYYQTNESSEGGVHVVGYASP